jgi:hypothetical protein
MNRMKKLAALATALAAMALVGASSASATTLETGGTVQNQSVAFTLSLKSGISTPWRNTSGITQNTCTTSTLEGNSSSPFTSTAVTGPVNTLTFSSCNRTVTVHDPGKLEVVHISGTTNGTVYSEETQLTTGSPIGTLWCVTEETTHMGTLTGVSSGNATLHVNSTLDCGLISAKWEGTYTVTSPSGLGVVA